MKYLKYILFCILLLNGINSIGQITGSNLVQNPSFELYDTCPSNNAQLYLSKNWWGFSCEYFNSCTSNLYFGVPMNGGGYQLANTGNAYAGFVAYRSPIVYGIINEYPKSKLQVPLKKDIRYCSNYYLSLANFSLSYSSFITLDSIGIYFSLSPVIDSIIPLSFLKPQVYNSISNLDTINWKNYKGSFISDGNEEYITIGNFCNSVIPTSTGISEPYIYIDDVSVCECSFNINLGADTALCLEEKLLLRANIPNAVYTWQDSSHAATYEVKQPGTYWLRAYFPDYNISTSDTIVIKYKDCNTALRIPNTFTPNGDGLNDVFEYFYAEYYEITTFIYNRWGELLFQSRNTDFWDGKYKEKTVAPGVYVYRIEAIRKDTQQKKIHCGSVTVI